MSTVQKPQNYREMIDRLVAMCREGQGQLEARRIRDGVWNKNARPDYIPEQHEINVLLKRLSAGEREVIARMLADSVVTGVFETLKLLEEFEVQPFQDGYEGSAFNDFIGRLNDWDWPKT